MKFANTNRTDNGEGKPLCTCILLICCYIYKTSSEWYKIESKKYYN
jgi:hypothetical protein